MLRASLYPYALFHVQVLVPELQMVMGCLILVLGTKPKSSAKAVSALNCYAIYPAPIFRF